MKPQTTTNYLLLAAGGVFSFSTAACHQTESSVKPNIIIVYADDLDFDELSIYKNTEFPCYNGMKELGLFKPDPDDSALSHFQNQVFMTEGEMAYYSNPVMHTPTINKLASEGALFNRFYVTSSVCTPSRYSLLTGRFASKSLGVVRDEYPGNVLFNAYIEPDEDNIAKVMKRAGYETGFVGKWHNNLPEWNEMRLASRALQNRDPEDAETKSIYQGFYNRSVLYLQEKIGFDLADRVYTDNKEALPVPRKMKAHNLEWITEGAIDFITKERDKPFFLYMALTLPHGRYYSDWIKDDPLATPAGMLTERPKGMPSRESILKTCEDIGIGTQNALATVIDYSILALIESLHEKKIADNTVLIFTSDHQSRGKNTCYEVCRVPMFVWWGNKIKPGTQINDLIANIDILPTLVDMAGAKLSENYETDGKSFLPWLTGEEKSEFRKALLLESGFSRAVVTRNYKYLVNRPPEKVDIIMREEATKAKATNTRRRIGWDGRPNRHAAEPGIWFYADRDFPHYFDYDQMYNLQTDYFEQTNIINNEEGQRVLPEMKSLLRKLLSDMNYPYGEFTE
jgi:arylsulfatase A-like enzyme